MTRELLHSIGYNDVLIEFYITHGKIKEQDNTLIILDEELLQNIILAAMIKDKAIAHNIIFSMQECDMRLYLEMLLNLLDKDFDEAQIKLNTLIKSKNDYYKNVACTFDTLLNGKSKDKLYITLEDNVYMIKEIGLVKEYIKGNQSMLAYDLLDDVIKNGAKVEHMALQNILELLPDETKYMLDESIYPSKVTRDGLKAIERKVLIYLEIGNVNKAVIELEKLKYLYQFQDQVIFANLFSLLNKIQVMQKDKKMVSLRNYNTIYGDFNSVLYELLRTNDFYRVIELVNAELEKYPTSIYLNILHILCGSLDYLNKRNMGYVKTEMDLNNNGMNEISDFNKYHVSSFNRTFLEDLESIKNMEEDNKINYYKLYERELKNKNYRNALFAIKAFDRKMRKLGIYKNVDYLILEVEILLTNSKDNINNVNLANMFYDEAISAMECGSYQDAIYLFLEHSKYLVKQNPRVFALIGKCYKELNRNKDAIDFYKEADKVFLYPEDYLDLIDCLFNEECYEEIPSYVSKYEKYYPEENIRLHYLLSIVYLKLADYEHAEDEIHLCEAMSVYILNMPITYDYELSIIAQLRNGEVIVPYSLKDFIDYDMSKKEYEMADSLISLEKCLDTSLTDAILNNIEKEDLAIKDKIEYLLSVTKIFAIKERTEDVKCMCSYIETFMEEENLESDARRRFTKTLKNYKNL